MGRVWGFLRGVVHRSVRREFAIAIGRPRAVPHQFQLKDGSVTLSSTCSPHREYLTDGNGAEGPLAAYKELCRLGRLRPGDVAQEQVAAALEKLSKDLSRRGKPNMVQGWFAKLRWKVPPMDDYLQGLYIYGGVGRGKGISQKVEGNFSKYTKRVLSGDTTMLMDLFYDKVSSKEKRRVHFHAFMLDVHGRLHSLLMEQPDRAAVSSIKVVAEQLMKEAFLLCLDEVEVTDIADALILRRLFAVLWRLGMVVVATSNSGPDQLYKDGLNRSLVSFRRGIFLSRRNVYQLMVAPSLDDMAQFEPFIEQLKEHCRVYSLDGAQSIDYRRSLLRLDHLYLHPLTEDTDDLLDKSFLTLTGGVLASSKQVPVMMGRKLEILAANGVARAKFSVLCGGPYGAADYIAIAKGFRALFLDRIPWLGDPSRENEARRFITLIDVLYETKVLFVCSADVSSDDLFVEKESRLSNDEVNTSSSVKDPSNLQIVDEGGSSGRSTTLIGGMEWSATGRLGVSLAKLGGSSNFTQAASGRTVSRLLEMQSQGYLAQTGPFTGVIQNNFKGSD